MYNINICFVLLCIKNICVNSKFLKIIFFSFFPLEWVSLLLFIRKSILHPVSQKCKIFWSLDKIGIEHTESKLNPNFFHPRPQSTTPLCFCWHIHLLLSKYFTLPYWLGDLILLKYVDLWNEMVVREPERWTKQL